MRLHQLTLHTIMVRLMVRPYIWARTRQGFVSDLICKCWYAL